MSSRHARCADGALALALLLLAGVLSGPQSAAAHGSPRDEVTVLMPVTEHFNPQWCPNTIARQAVNPRLASNCAKIVIPPRLCVDCVLRAHNAKGVFATSQRDIYRTEDAACRRQLLRYRAANACDWPRTRDISDFYGLHHRGPRAYAARKVPAWRRAQAKKDLGEFMYNVCELCCDCVPIGLDHKKPVRRQFWERRKRDRWWTGPKTLIDVHRGNCPVHYYYDTCRMWPKIRDVANWHSQINLNGKDEICTDHVYPWWNNPKRYWNNWPWAKKVPIPSARFRNYLVKMSKVLRCRNRQQWEGCARMEMAQGRV